MRWKVATGMALDHKGFDASTLVYWRKRLARSDRPHRINDAVKTVIEQTGILRGRRKRAVDSTILADAVATQDTVTQLISAMRRVSREVPGASETIASQATGYDYSRAGKPTIDWEDPGAKDALVSALVNDANAVVAALAEVDLDELDEQAQAALALLALVAGQDVEPAEGSDGTDGRWRIARKVAEDRVVSIVDPDARHTRKSPEARRDGYRAHVAAEPETGIITDEALTKAAGSENSDPGVAEKFLACDDGGEQDTREWFGDSAYGTGVTSQTRGRSSRRYSRPASRAPGCGILRCSPLPATPTRSARALECRLRVRLPVQPDRSGPQLVGGTSSVLARSTPFRSYRTIIESLRATRGTSVLIRIAEQARAFTWAVSWRASPSTISVTVSV